MDVLSFLGVILAFAAVIGGNYLEGGSAAALLNAPAAIIVIGGTLAAAMLQTPGNKLRRALRRFIWIFSPPKVAYQKGIQKVVHWSVTARKEGLLGLETVAEREKDLFAKKGLLLLADGGESETIRSTMEMESSIIEQVDHEAATFYEAMGGYAPTIGILGAVMGLINVMGNLADPSKLGDGIAIAFVATIYGVAFANLFLLPIAAKLRHIASDEMLYRELIIEGVMAIADGENPRMIELKLNGFVTSHSK